MDKKSISEELASQGYSVLKGLSVKNASWDALLQSSQKNILSFHQSWNDLPTDNFLSDGGHYRFRRYSVFHWLNDDDKLTLLPHEPHFQSTYRNNMNGGIYREFEAFNESTIGNPLIKTIVTFVAGNISFNDEKEWRIQAHQFRIQASAGEAGQPTPEGIHRDGADFILIMVLGRHNITGGVNHIYDDGKRLVFGGVLENAGDAVLIDDRKVWHGVSEVYPVNEDQPAYRDVLVLTFHNQMML
ncbi:MAG: 2OG-Fe dioxygenase family protein [Thiotrichaceae bacterium]|nr:2OG-Fe dioxygenase family protein [Thiotrichaceae bacterium]